MNLKEFARAHGTNLKKVAEQCGVPASTLYAISSGDTNFDNVGIGTFIKVAKALNVGTDELYNMDFGDCPDTPEPDKSKLPPLSGEEEELLDLYRRMDDQSRETLLNTARSFAALAGVGQERSGKAAGQLVM